MHNSLLRLLVVAVGWTPGERRYCELALNGALRDAGVGARASYRLIGDARVDSALVDARMRRTECDDILVSRVVDRLTGQRSHGGFDGRSLGVPAYYGGPPSVYHRGWWPYFSSGYGYATTGTASATLQRVSVETSTGTREGDSFGRALHGSGSAQMGYPATKRVPWSAKSWRSCSVRALWKSGDGGQPAPPG